jgi:peroxiredoxin
VQKKLIILQALFILFLGATAQHSGHSITFEIKGLQDTALFMGSHYGNKSLIIDTTKHLNKKYTFEGQNTLTPGVYFLFSGDKKKLIEFIVDEDQTFKLKTDTLYKVKPNDIKGSDENKLFFEYVEFTEKMHHKATSINNKINQGPLPDDSLDHYKSNLKNISKEVADYKNNFETQNPDHILSLIFATLKQPTIPEDLDPKDENFQKLQYHYYKSNYWTNINLSDPRLLRTPVFYNKLSTYFDKVVPQHPDSIIKEMDLVMLKTDTSDLMLNYLAWYFVEKFDQEEVMGMDKVFVHLANTYFNDSTRVLTTESVLKKIRDRATVLTPLLIGKAAPNLILYDTANNFTSFHNLESEYIVLFFWDYNCGVCKKEVKKLKALQDSLVFDVQIFAICTDTNLTSWKNKIKDYKIENWANANGTRSITQDYHKLYDVYATPLIYILNKKREIIAKKISAKQIEQFLKHYSTKKE